MADYSELKRKAQEIRDEVKAGANTANRVGLALEETVKALEVENQRAEEAEVSLENAVQLLQDETENLQSIRGEVERLGNEKADKTELEKTNQEVSKKQDKLEFYKEDPSNGSVEIFAQDVVSIQNDSQGGVSCVKTYNEEDTEEGLIPVARMSAEKDNGDSASVTVRGNEVHIDGDAVKVNGVDLENIGVTIVNDLTTGGADKALSAEMGKELAKEVTELGKEVEDFNTLKKSNNLIDFDKVVSYAYLDTKGSLAESQYVDWKVSDFIKVKKGDTIIANASKISVYISVYDIEKHHVRNTDDRIYHYEEGDYYIRITFNGNKESCRANYGETLLPYEPYYKTSVKDAIFENEDNITELYNKIDSVNSEIENSNIYEESSNLVDFDKISSYAYLDSNGTVQPALSEDWRVSDFIAVTKGDIISANASKVSVYIAVYDTNKNHVRNTDDKIYRYKNRDSYIRITFNGRKTACHANYGETLLPYEPYYKKNVKDAIRDNEDRTIGLYKLTNNICRGVDLSIVYGFHQWGDENLVGKFLNVQLTETSDDKFMTTEYIPIAEGVYDLTYSSIGNCAVVIYDRFKDKILAWDNNAYKLDGFGDSGGVFSAPKGSCYIRICCYRNTPISLIPQANTGNSEIFRVYKGKKLVTIGDSITQQKSWQKKLSVFQGLKWDSNETNHGVGVHYEDADGNRYAEYDDGRIEVKNAPMGLAGTGIRPVYVTEQPNESSPTWVNGNKGCSIYDRAKDAQFYNPDIVILWPCANDFSTVNIPALLGTIEDEPYIGNSVKVNYMSEPNGITIYSSLKGTLQILSSTCPNARIVVLGLMPWMIYSLDDYERYMSMEKKMNNVIEECCKLYNIQYVDMFSIGCNYWNQEAYYTKTDGPTQEGHDTSDRQVHPNDAGCLIIAEYLSSFL